MKSHPYATPLLGKLPFFHNLASQTPKTRKVHKLGTFDGVFLPTSLNVLSILMFLRFGFIIGQAGILGTFVLLLLSYAINILTTLSVSAIATNGTVKGGGAYYMISRSLGPEFGGAIGIIFFVGQILNASLNVLGFIEPLLANFEYISDLSVAQFAYSSIVLAVCTSIAMVGSRLVAKTALCLFVVLSISTLSIPLSVLIVQPFMLPHPFNDLQYTGPSLATMRQNWLPHLTSGAAGSVQPLGVSETFRNLFGIFFPATAGIFAGSSMSGELKTPSRSIPRGTLYGLLVSFIFYVLVIVAMGVSIPRPLLHRDINVIQAVNINRLLIIAGEFSTALFSVIMGIVGAASLLNAIADDAILPGLYLFVTSRKEGHALARSKYCGILATWLLAQIFLLANVNQIANLITMAFLMTFIVTNIACFLLRIGSAPNFRPAFKYFSSKTAFAGALFSMGAMFIVDGISATIVISLLLLLIVLIHYLTPPSKFGDISQLLIYHQVRKYLLRLKVDMSVKYWRPQILLLCDDPQTSWNLIGFCNSLKKGGLYVLGHVIVAGNSNSDTFSVQIYNEVRRQKQAWIKLRDFSGIKAFVHVSIGPTLPWGVRNVYLGSGLGGMKPNITVLGFYDFKKNREPASVPVIAQDRDLPTDVIRKERKVSVTQWVQIIEDLVIMQATIAVAANFSVLAQPSMRSNLMWSFFRSSHKEPPLNKVQKKFIDLYPIQMSSYNTLDNGQSVLSTNFDTYTLILQLGAILVTVPEWRLSHELRIIAFVESRDEFADEYQRLAKLLTSLRFEATIIVISLSDQNLVSYDYIVKGASVPPLQAEFHASIEEILGPEQWWQNLCIARSSLQRTARQEMTRDRTVNCIYSAKPIATCNLEPLNVANSYHKPTVSNPLQTRRYTLSNLHEQGLSLLLSMSIPIGSQFPVQHNPFDDTESDSSDSSKEPLEYGSVKRPNLYERSSLIGGDRMVDCNTQQPPSNSRSIAMPNFLSVKIPESHVNSGDEDEACGDDEVATKPSIRFLYEEQNATDESYPEIGQCSTRDTGLSILTTAVPAASETKSRREPSKLRVENLMQHHKHTSKSPSRPPSIFSNDAQVLKQLGSPKYLQVEEGKVVVNNSLNTVTAETFSKATDDPNRMNQNGAGGSLQIIRKKLQAEVEALTFNDIPATGQHIILNELMKNISPLNRTSIIFSTLPAPAINTHGNENSLLEYTRSLAIWLQGLPPTMLVNSQTVTVTTSL